MPKRSIIMMLLLSLVTCGIYNFIWIYMARKEFRDYTGKTSINPALELLLSFFCLPYLLYWCYLFSRDIAEVQRQREQPQEDLTILSILLTFFGFLMVAEMIFQAQLNELPEK